MSTPVASDLSELKVIKKAGPNFTEVKSMQLAPFSTSHQRGRLDQQPVFALRSKWLQSPSAQLWRISLTDLHTGLAKKGILQVSQVLTSQSATYTLKENSEVGQCRRW